MSKGENSKSTWSGEETAIFLKLAVQHEDLTCSQRGRCKNRTYAKLSEAMKGRGFDKNSRQCRAKWKQLKADLEGQVEEGEGNDKTATADSNGIVTRSKLKSDSGGDGGGGGCGTLEKDKNEEEIEGKGMIADNLRQIAQVCIKWNAYEQNMKCALPAILNMGKYSDTILMCEGRMMKCHKLILSACSSYFDELFTAAKNHFPVIIVNQVEYWQLETIVNFMYKGEVRVCKEKLPALLEAAEKLRVKGLAEPTAKKEENAAESPASAAAASTCTDDSTSDAKELQTRKKKRRLPKLVKLEHKL